MNLFLFGLLGLMLAGCTMTYTKPGLTQEEFNRDRYECQKEADAAAVGASVGEIGRAHV